MHRIRGIAGINGFDRLHNIHIGVIDKVIESFKVTLKLCRSLEAAVAWQVSYLAYARVHARFAGLRIFATPDSNHTFDNNNSFTVLLPLLFGSFLFTKSEVSPVGPTEVLMALVTFVQLSYPAQKNGFSTTQLGLLQQSAHKYV